MSVVGHHYPFLQQIPVLVKVPHCDGDEFSNVRPSKVAGASASVEVAFDLAAKVTRDFFSGIIDLFAALRKVVQPAQSFRLFPLKLQHDIRGQRISQTKRDKVGSTFAFHMRKISAIVNSGAQWIRCVSLHAARTQLITRALPAWIRLVKTCLAEHGARLTGEFRIVERGCGGVSQVSKPAVSPISKSARLSSSHGAQVWKPAIRQTWKSALHVRLGACLLLAALVTLPCSVIRAETVSIILSSNAVPRVEFGAQKLVEALKTASLDGTIVRSANSAGPKIHLEQTRDPGAGREGFAIELMGNNDQAIVAGDDSGALYGCLALAERIRATRQFPLTEHIHEKPAMTLRGTCIGMQKTYILPGRKVYEYPYTPDLFPWFYDKDMWREYLDFLAANRMNTLYLWSGHPFASLVRLKDYPEAVEVPDDVFQKNVEMFRWLTAECDRRGIWLVQMFYNIFLPKPLADKRGVSTQLSAPTPLASDYTRKAIAEFVKQYPNVGLMVCLGEALQGTPNQIAWCTNTILPGVLDGMKAAGLKEQPPVVIRTHAMNPEAIMPACFLVYSNLFTETKYNGESLTTYEPRGKGQATHLAMAKLGPHLVNIHILSNLEPFRYGAPDFIRKSVLASRDRLGASGVHLYPLSYWNWPYSPDSTDPPLKQWDRDWIWFEAWARYSWSPDVPESEDHAYWVGRLADVYGCDTNAAEKILTAYNDSGEIAPQLIRRFGITEGNRQTLSLGMTLDQLVNPQKYGAIEDLWLSQAPPGERLDEFVRKESAHEAHTGETPDSVLRDVQASALRAILSIDAAGLSVTKHREEFQRLQNDIHCIRVMAAYYAAKVEAAKCVLRFGVTRDVAELEHAEGYLSQSLDRLRELTGRTTRSYRFANSMQTGHRKIPFNGAVNGIGTNYHWTQVLPLYQKELAEFKASSAELKRTGTNPARTAAGVSVAAWPAAKFQLISTNAETYELKVGARPFVDRKYTITKLAPELNGLTGIRFSHEEAKNGRYVPVEFEVAEPVRVLIGYFQDQRELWLQVPNLDVASQADERGGVDVVLRNAAEIEECPGVNVHAFRYGPGRHKLELIGKGSFVVLGVVLQSATLEKRDVK
jgi:hypothetical protein